MTIQSINQHFGNFDVISILDQRMGSERDHFYTSKSFLKNENIYLQNRTANKIFFIKEGRVKIGAHSNEGKEVIKKVAMRGEIFGEFSLLGQTISKDYAVAMEDTEVYMLTREELQFLLLDHKSFSLHLIRILSDRLIDMEARLEAIVFKSSRERIIDFLKKLAHQRGQRVGYEMLVRNFFTHQEIANLTATSRQTVTMVLNELRNKNILTFNRRRLLIRDMALLQAEAA